MLLVEFVVWIKSEINDCITLVSGVFVADYRAVFAALNTFGLLGYNHVDEARCVWAVRPGDLILSLTFFGLDHQLIN